eukprot:15325636-Ditylum_brightwellii.AAC.1
MDTGLRSLNALLMKRVQFDCIALRVSDALSGEGAANAAGAAFGARARAGGIVTVGMEAR